MRSRSLVGGITILLAACGGAAASASPSALPTDSAASSAPATTSVPALGSTTHAPAPTAPTSPHPVALRVDGDVPGFLVRWGDGFVALGANHVWVSENGLAWQVSETSGIGGYVVRLVEGGDGTLVAFGYSGDGRAPDSFRTWTSADGRNWQAAEGGLPTEFIFLDIGRGERGYVLVGRAILDGASPEQLWFSPDAVSWQLTYGTSDDEFLAAVGAGPEGFVAVGQLGFRMGSPRALVLASGDGRNWIKATDSQVLADAGSLWSVVPLHGDWVTSPLTVGSELSLLWSQNGLDWEQLAASLPIDRDDSGVIGSLMSNGSRLFAAVGVGSDQSATSVLLTSLDGAAWSPTDIPLTGFAGGFASVAGVNLFLVDGAVHTHRD